MLSTLPKTHHRIEICPPERGSATPWQRLRAWACTAWPMIGADGAPGDELAPIRREFAEAMADLAGEHADILVDRLYKARSLRELWHLRAQVFSLVALQHSQHEADLRLARLNRHFPTRSPRSGFGALESRAMWP